MFTMTGSEVAGRQQIRPVVRRLGQAVGERLKAIATSGLSPRDLARTICVGAAIGLLPLVWGSSLLCILAGHWFRLNQPALQSINYLLYPLQLALLMPFCLLGMRLLPWGPVVSRQQLSGLLLHGHFIETLPLLAWLSLKGVLVWGIVVPPTAALVYRLLIATMIRRRESTVIAPAL